MATLTKKQEKLEAIESAKQFLLKVLKPGDEVKTVLYHVSRSGMSRDIGVIISIDNVPTNISWHVAKALDYPMTKGSNSIRVGGCGMDMGYHLIYQLSRVLFKDSIDYKDAGYALEQGWL